MRLFQFLNAACVVFAAGTCPAPEVPVNPMDTISAALKLLLSTGATISSTAPPRWSLYSAPKPAAVVNVATEEDVAAVVWDLRIYFSQNYKH
jgi:hypothetical protein